MATIDLDDIWPRYMFLDPASSKRKQALKGVRARSAIVVCGTDALSRIWVLDACASRGSTNAIRKAYLDLYEQWLPEVCGFEDVGQQSLLEDPLIDAAKDRGIENLPLVAVTPSTKVEKNFRIRSILQRPIGAGRLIIREDLLELIDEITSFPMNSLKDLIDALASCVDLIPPPTTEQETFDEAQELARYLRDTGTPPREIEARVAEIRGVDTRERWWDSLTRQRRVGG